MKNSIDKRLKIAIFSGEIPSTTFIEHLIVSVSEFHEVQLYGILKKQVGYGKNITIIKTPQNKLSNLFLTCFRGMLLFVKEPSKLFRLVNEIRGYKDWFSRWVWFSKLLPIILYKPDIFHIQWAEDLEFYECLQSKFDIPIVLSCRGAHISYKPIVNPNLKTFYQDQFPKIKEFHAVSEDMKAQAIALGANPDRVKVIHSPISDSILKKFESRPQLNTDRQMLKIISAGRFHWKKGYDYAIRAMALLKEKGVSFKYTIVAQGNIPESIRFSIHDLGLEKNIEVINGMPQDKLLNEMQSNDVLILPSLEEGIANVVLEAMAIGVPVISTDCGGMKEVVKQGETGWVVPVRDPEAIAKAIMEMTSRHGDGIRQVIENAHQLIRKQFNQEHAIEQFLELYKRIKEIQRS